MTIKAIQEEIIDEFAMFDDWMERYEYLIELGRSLPLIEDQYKTDDNIIKGCQSKVWIHSNIEADKVNFTADSDAILTKGMVALFLHLTRASFSKKAMIAPTSSPLTFPSSIALPAVLVKAVSSGPGVNRK